MPPKPPIPPGPPTPTSDAGSDAGREPVPGSPPKDSGDKKSIPDSLSGYGFDKQAVRELIERYFRVYEERDALPGFDRALLVAFYVLAEKADIEAKLPQLQKELSQLDPQIMAMLREEGGETLIVVTRRPRESRETRSHLPLVLGLLTLLTVAVAGSIVWTFYAGEREIAGIIRPMNILNGLLWFTLPLMLFFGVQEAARRFVARRHGVDLRTSLLIPVPPILIPTSIATFGSVLNLKNPTPNRKALFDLAAAGPLAGFLLAILLVVIGFGLTLSTGIAAPGDTELEMTVTAPDNETWRESDDALFARFDRSTPDEPHNAHNITVDFRVETAGRAYGTEDWRIDVVPRDTAVDGVNYTLSWRTLGEGGQVLASNQTEGGITRDTNATYTFDLPDGTHAVEATLEYHVPERLSVPLGEPLVFALLSDWILDDRDDLFLHPTGLAGWTALFLVGVTLLPMGRFDGGGIARAMLGDRMTILGYITLAGLAVLTLFYAGWVYLILIVVLFLSVRHPVPLDDTTPLDRTRQLFTLVMLLILVVSFVPLPAQLPDLGFLQ